ncbi:hypothetical protein GWI33_003938 [Rhynchophorus ferrugineus]|uniref:Uncharacterized protein n=1 Tax=Rhynchophorus ferrugineus TaxID=354439 RepID=A0A834HLV5_RHYFE|nr:hypothetical protein GWI33_003938 [Rhynchophorus ferrugineus]
MAGFRTTLSVKSYKRFCAAYKYLGTSLQLRGMSCRTNILFTYEYETGRISAIFRGMQRCGLGEGPLPVPARRVLLLHLLSGPELLSWMAN